MGVVGKSPNLSHSGYKGACKINNQMDCMQQCLRVGKVPPHTHSVLVKDSENYTVMEQLSK